MIYISLLLMLPLVFLASSFPLFILLTKLDEKGIAKEVFGILIGMFLLGTILLQYG